MVTPLGLSMDTCPGAFKCQFSIFHYDDNFQPSFYQGALHGPWSHVGDLVALTEIFGPPPVNRGPTEIIEFLLIPAELLLGAIRLQFRENSQGNQKKMAQKGNLQPQISLELRWSPLGVVEIPEES